MRVVGVLMICMMLVGCNPNIQLDRNEWVCTETSVRKVDQLISAGKAIIPTKSDKKICIKWELLE